MGWNLQLIFNYCTGQSRMFPHHHCVVLSSTKRIFLDRLHYRTVDTSGMHRRHRKTDLNCVEVICEITGEPSAVAQDLLY